MKIKECMTAEPRVMSPEQSLHDAARVMKDMDVGFLPVGQDDRLVGVVTDRDIIIRGVSDDADGATRIADVMSHDVRYCYEDENVEDVLDKMGQLQIRRLPVINQDKRLTGVVSLGDLSQIEANSKTANALCEISMTGNPQLVSH